MSTAAVASPLPHLEPVYKPGSSPTGDSASIQAVITGLGLQPHIEGGYFAETDRAPSLVPTPFPYEKSSTVDLAPQRPGFNPAFRNASTTIHYLLTPNGPQGGFHRNKARTVHTLHRGRGRYVIIHADEPDLPAEQGGGKRIETFVVGHDLARGEKLQWIVEGNKYKASFLLPDNIEEGDSQGLLISETVVPGFEYSDHDFLTEAGLVELVGKEKAANLTWLLSPLASA